MAYYWQRPTQQEADEQHILAWLVFTSYADDGRVIVQPCAYNHTMMQRRYKRLGLAGVPDFVEVFDNTFNDDNKPDLNNLDDWFPQYEWSDNDA